MACRHIRSPSPSVVVRLPSLIPWWGFFPSRVLLLPSYGLSDYFVTLAPFCVWVELCVVDQCVCDFLSFSQIFWTKRVVSRYTFRSLFVNDRDFVSQPFFFFSSFVYSTYLWVSGFIYHFFSLFYLVLLCDVDCGDDDGWVGGSVDGWRCEYDCDSNIHVRDVCVFQY